MDHTQRCQRHRNLASELDNISPRSRRHLQLKEISKFQMSKLHAMLLTFNLLLVVNKNVCRSMIIFTADNLGKCPEISTCVSARPLSFYMILRTTRRPVFSCVSHRLTFITSSVQRVIYKTKLGHLLGSTNVYKQTMRMTYGEVTRLSKVMQSGNHVLDEIHPMYLLSESHSKV